MNTIRHHRYALACIAIIISLAMIAMYLHRADVPKGGEGYWEARIRVVGGVKAYEEFGTTIATSTPDVQHGLAHVFGAALYDVEGTRGITVCDERFAQGCMHEILGKSVVADGIGAVADLFSECSTLLAENSRFCQHGIGHGLVSYFGYDESALTKALSICDSYESRDPLNGCFNGVFMEYFLRNVLTSDDSPRPVEQGDWYAPCPVMQGTAAWSCWFALPRWWHQIYKHDNLSEDAILQKMSDLCADVPESDDRLTCFDGLGQTIPVTAGYDPILSVSLCEGMSSEPRYQLACRAEAANNFLLEGRPIDAEKLCGDLVGESYAYCHAYATIVSEKTITVPFPPL